MKLFPFSTPRIGWGKISLTHALTLVLAAVLAYEAYLVYDYIYRNVFIIPEQPLASEVVRVDLPAYQAAIEYLDQRINFVAETPDLANPNPFQP